MGQENQSMPVRHIDLAIQDVVARTLSGVSLDANLEIKESMVQGFCSGCDKLQASGLCNTIDANDQARYAARQYCGWSVVNGVRGEMTEAGFKSAE